MKRETAIKKLMGLGASRNDAKKYLDDMHKRDRMSNKDACIQYGFELLVNKAMRVRGMTEVGE
jgi:hypothetical protein